MLGARATSSVCPFFAVRCHVEHCCAESAAYGVLCARAQDGEKVAYITSQGERLLTGSVRIDPRGASGILCACCAAVVSCSQFEAHAGRGSRRAPYDNIFTAVGISLRRLAMLMPAAEVEEPSHYRTARGAGAAAAVGRCAPTPSSLDSISSCAPYASTCRLTENGLFMYHSVCPVTVMKMRCQWPRLWDAAVALACCAQCQRKTHASKWEVYLSERLW